MFNPIIPVAKRIPVSWQTKTHRHASAKRLGDGYVKFFEPDVFVEATSGLAAEIGISARRSIHPRVLSLPDFLKTDDNASAFQFGLNMFDAYKYLYEHNFKFASRHKRRIAYFQVPKYSDPFTEVAFGAFPKDAPLRFIERGYLDAFAPERLASSPESWLKVFTRQYRTPLDATMWRLEVDYQDGWDEPTLFVFNPRESIDLIDFWNLRQFRRSVLPVPVAWIATLKNPLEELIKSNYRPLPRNPQGIMRHSVIEFARSISEIDARKIVGSYFSGVPRGSLSFKTWYEPIWAQSDYSELMNRPRHARLTAEDGDLDISLSSSQQSARVNSLYPDFARRYGAGSSRWANVYSFKNYSPGEDLALAYPSNTKDDDFPRLGFGEPTIVSSEGFVFLEQFKRKREYVRFQRGREAISEWLHKKGIEAKPSDPGRVAEQVISSVGGLRGCQILADGDTLRQLDKMAKSARVRSQSTGDLEEEFPDRTASVNEWKGILSRRSQRRQFPSITLSSLVNSGILRLGYSIRCTSCDKENWYSLHELDYRVRCERCLREFEFPQGTVDPNHSNWRYRVIGPFSVPNFAGGAYATALALRVFAHGLGPGENTVTYSTNLSIDEGKGEIDFVLWYRRDRLLGGSKEPNVVIGEAKSFANDAFKKADATRLKTLARKLPGSFLAVAFLKADLSAGEKKLLRALAEWGRESRNGHPRAPVIVLMGRELFFDWNINQEWKTNGGRPAHLVSPAYVQIDNLWTLAEFTQQVYLDMPSVFEWSQKKRQQSLPRTPTGGGSIVPDLV